MTITVNGKTIETDNEGYLLNPQDWTEEVGLEMVKQHEAEGHRKVNETGWMLIKFAHEFYEDHMRHPNMNELIRQHEKLEHKTFRQENDYKQNLYDMFPHGPIRMIAKMAGIPRTAIAEEVSGG